MGSTKGRRAQPRRRKGPTPRKRPVAAGTAVAASQARTERTGTPVAAGGRYTPPRKHRGLDRPTWHKLVGGALIPVGLTLFIACEASLWGIHDYGGHIWYLVGLFIAISSTWWFGLFDRSETRW